MKNKKKFVNLPLEVYNVAIYTVQYHNSDTLHIWAILRPYLILPIITQNSNYSAAISEVEVIASIIIIKYIVPYICSKHTNTHFSVHIYKYK